jgi:hypothetical protein
MGLPANASAGAADRTVLGVCLKYRENVLIHDAGDAKILSHLPEWLRNPDAPCSFALFPVVGGSALVGLVLVGWTAARHLVIPPPAVSALAKFFNVLGRFCETDRASLQASPGPAGLQ